MLQPGAWHPSIQEPHVRHLSRGSGPRLELQQYPGNLSQTPIETGIGLWVGEITVVNQGQTTRGGCQLPRPARVGLAPASLGDQAVQPVLVVLFAQPPLGLETLQHPPGGDRTAGVGVAQRRKCAHAPRWINPQGVGQRGGESRILCQLNQHRIDRPCALRLDPQDPVDLRDRLLVLPLLQVALRQPGARREVAGGSSGGDFVKLESLGAPPMAISRLCKHAKPETMQRLDDQQLPSSSGGRLHIALLNLTLGQR